MRLNHIRTAGYGRFRYNKNQMGLSPSKSCECGAASQTAHHMASECPLPTGTWSCWTVHHATCFATCSVTYRTIGLYRENAIAIESEARDPFGGNVYYVTMEITFPIPEFARKGCNLHCGVVHVTTKCVSRLVLYQAIAAIQMSR